MSELEDRIAEIAGAAVRRVERVQSLWGGYGELVRAHLVDSRSVVVKRITPPATIADAGDRRKRRSYEVEIAFYRRFAERAGARCRVARLVGARADRAGWLLVLEDLDAAGFARRLHDPDGEDLDACLAWLAAFHGRFLGAPPDGLWPVGTYWHLATRAEELAATPDVALRARAPELDRALRAARFQTIVHGDAKPENFCFADEGARVAAVDFQYAGGGPGIKDVAYLLWGAPPAVEARALETYFARLRAELAADVDADALEREWRALYPVARDDFRRFLAGWRR